MALFEDIGKFGELLSGLSLFVGAIIAGVSYWNFNRRTLYASWMEKYREAYAEFWNDSVIAEVRSWIINKQQYASLENILVKRLASKENDLTSDENLKLEKLDRFCALIFRIDLLQDDAMTRKQRSLWREIGGIYWLEKMQTPDRMALKKYVEQYWPNLNSGISNKLFVYGSLTNPAKLREQLGRSCESGGGQLRGYELKQGKWQYIIPNEGKTVRGRVLLNLTAADFEKLDKYEEVHPELREGKMRCLYVRKLVPVSIGIGRVKLCWVYLPNLPDWLPDWLQQA
jgi:gamma-glutamylcyclotransferase (GGCT)/AIG2-like uncharacterized protein YtfP